MKKRFKTKINCINYIYILIIIIFIILYVMFYNNINYLIIDSYNNEKYNKSLSDLIYLYLPKTTNFNSITYDEIDHYIDINISNKPIVYIYNTHQSEAYNYKDLSYSIKPTVLFASYILKDYLNDYGVESIVESSSISDYLKENNLIYRDSYEASRYFLNIANKKYDTLEYYIDIHRDSSTIDKTLYKNDNKNYARVLFVVGLRHENSSKNLEFVKEINNIIEKKYPGLSRGIYERKTVIFNQDVSSKAILLELGGVDNTLEEINNTLEIFSQILYEYIEENNGN